MEEKRYSQVKAMLAISKASLRSIMRSPSAVVFTLAFPLIFILVFGFISGGGFVVKVGVSKNSSSGNPVYLVLKNIPAIRLVENTPDAELMSELQKGRIDGIITLSTDTMQHSKIIIDLKTTSASAEKGRVLKMILNDVVNQMNLRTSGMKSSVAEIRQQDIPGRKYKTIDFILPGNWGFRC